MWGTVVVGRGGHGDMLCSIIKYILCKYQIIKENIQKQRDGEVIQCLRVLAALGEE